MNSNWLVRPRSIGSGEHVVVIRDAGVSEPTAQGAAPRFYFVCDAEKADGIYGFKSSMPADLGEGSLLTRLLAGIGMLPAEGERLYPSELAGLKVLATVKVAQKNGVTYRNIVDMRPVRSWGQSNTRSRRRDLTRDGDRYGIEQSDDEFEDDEHQYAYDAEPSDEDFDVPDGDVDDSEEEYDAED